MKITAIETIRLNEFPNILWVHVHTDEGLIGLGEIFYGVDERDLVVYGTSRAEITAGEYGHPAWTARGGLHKASGELDAFSSQCVQVGCLDDRVSRGPKAVCTKLICEDEENIKRLCHRTSWLTQMGEDQAKSPLAT